MVYQPKFINDKVVSVEALLRIAGVDDIELYVRAVDDPIELDFKVINMVFADINKYNFQSKVSINVNYLSLVNDCFVDYCINLFNGFDICIELTEYGEVKNILKLKESVNKLSSAGVDVSLDDFGKDFSRADLLVDINFSQVKIDKSLIDNIEDSFSSYNRLKFLTQKIHNFGISSIVYEGVENETQSKIITFLNNHAIMQGYLYSRPLKMDVLINKFRDQISREEKKKKVGYSEILHVEKLIYELLKKNDTKVNDKILNDDWLDLIVNLSKGETVKNFKDIFYSRDDSDLGEIILSMIRKSNDVIAIRNSAGIVMFENLQHICAFGIQLCGVPSDNIIMSVPFYDSLISKDVALLDSPNFNSISYDSFFGIDYLTIRNKIAYKNNLYVIASSSPLVI